MEILGCRCSQKWGVIVLFRASTNMQASRVLGLGPGCRAQQLLASTQVKCESLCILLQTLPLQIGRNVTLDGEVGMVELLDEKGNIR